MSAQLIEMFASGFKAADGTNLAGGKVYHYVTGTTTAKDVYTDGGSVTPAAQPVVLDARGCAAIFGDGIYKFVIQDSTGAVVQTIDGVDVGRASNTGFLKADGSVEATGSLLFSNTKGITGKNSGGTTRAIASVDSVADTVLIGNTSSGCRILSSADPVSNIGGADRTLWNSGNLCQVSDYAVLNNSAGPLDFTITDGTYGEVFVWGIQNGVGKSYWRIPFMKYAGTLTIGTEVKVILTADPISGITVVSNNLRIAVLAANSYVRAHTIGFGTI